MQCIWYVYMIYLYIYTYEYMHTHTYIHIHTDSHTHTYIYIYVCVCICTYIYIYIYIYICNKGLYTSMIHGNWIISFQKIRRDQVNLLVYGPNRPCFKQKQKNNITKFWPSGSFLICYFLLFENKKQKKT